MAILIDETKRVLVQGITGREGQARTDPAVFNGIFMIARTPGLVAHVTEEQTREKPMRRIEPVRHGYDGPAPRKVKEA